MDASNLKNEYEEFLQDISEEPIAEMREIKEGFLNERKKKMKGNKKDDSVVDIAADVRKFTDTYRKGNLKLLEMMISQINDFIENTRHDEGPKSYVIDEDEINRKLCSTNKFAYMLDAGIDSNQLPKNEDIYSMDFFESINNYLDTKYKYEFYDIYTLMEMRGDLQRVYDDYNKHGYLPWDDKKEEEQMDASNSKNDKRRPRLEDFDPAVMVYDGEYEDRESPCSYKYEYVNCYTPCEQFHHSGMVVVVYKITKTDPRIYSRDDGRVVTRIVGICNSDQYLLMITNTKKFWEKYVEPRIEELEETKKNFIKMQEEKENESSI